ncbi:HD domain-containing protein [Candidatus Micrarchaeota archaeon]|nr:HD domain-containing protein [Candidatus Micrarchaeota archaeon]
MNLLIKYFDTKSEFYSILLIHSKKVMEKSLDVAERMINKGYEIDLKLIEESAFHHDIGLCEINEPKFDLHGKHPYIAHGYQGKLILNKEGFPKHGLVVERHVGMGITKQEIVEENLPLPKRDMVPITWEDKIVCYSDKFYSKNPKYGIDDELSLNVIRERMLDFKYGKANFHKFLEWHKLIT